MLVIMISKAAEFAEAEIDDRDAALHSFSES